MITHLPKSDEHNAILVIMNRLTKRAHFYTITDKFSFKDLAMILMERYYSLHELSLQIISDRGVQFAADLFQDWCKLLEIESAMTTAYHPQADEQTERVNQVLKQYLRCFIEQHQKDDWVSYLAIAKFAYNNAAHESTKHFPFFFEYGRNFRAKPSIVKESSRKDLNEIFIARQTMQKQAKAALQLAANRMKWYYDQKVTKVPFKIEDKVLLKSEDYQTSEKALAFKYLEPFTIVKQLTKVTFVLNLPL